MRNSGTTLALLICCLLCSAIPFPVWSEAEGVGADSLKQHFDRANALYGEGEYEKAITSYRRLLEAGVVDQALYYNLGNAYYKINKLGEAVLYYERALRLAPRDKDARENLALVRSQLRDKQFVQNRNRVVALAVWLHDNLSTGEMFLFASGVFLLLCLLLVSLVFRDSGVIDSLYGRMSLLSPGRLAGLTMTQDIVLGIVISAFLFVTMSASASVKLNREKARSEAVVMSEEVPVFGSPTEDGTLQFKIHEGTMVRVREERSSWVHVQLPGGLSGWVSSKSIEKV